MRATRKRNYRQLSPSPDAKTRKKQPKSRRLTSKSIPSSQSSADVPAVDKLVIKSSQNNRCWLCERKAHKTRRRLEICHVYPQAISKRTQFETHHKQGRLQMSNIHSKSNLIALCSVCHYAFDSEEWTFLPECTSAWVKAANDEPEKKFVPMWNNQRDIQYRRWRLGVDRYSEASNDKDFNSAFTNNPLKTWTGEVGAVILSRQLLTTNVENPSPGLDEAIDEFCNLCSLWRSYKGSCSDPKCPVCKGDGDRSDGDGGKDDNDNAKGSDDQEEDQDRENRENEGDEGDEEEKEEDEGEDGRTGDEEYDEDEVDEEEEGQHEDNGKKSSLYDTSVPYSYRKGYTLAGTTSNELMAMWQGLPYVKQNNGQITLIQPNQRTLSRADQRTLSREARADTFLLPTS